MPLTDVAIRALKPEAKRYSRTDERGLVIEVFPTGGMLWHYRSGPRVRLYGAAGRWKPRVAQSLTQAAKLPPRFLAQ